MIMPYKVEILSRAARTTGKFNIEYKEPISMCNQWGHANFDKVKNIVNDINTEEVMIIDDNCFEKGKLNN